MLKLIKHIIVGAVLGAGLICTGFAKDQEYYLEIDEYLGQPVESVEATLGEPSADGIDMIYADYKSDSLIAPEYSMYFPSEELKHGVQVRILEWNNDAVHSVVWAKQDAENYGDWIVFTSVAHDDKVQF